MYAERATESTNQKPQGELYVQQEAKGQTFLYSNAHGKEICQSGQEALSAGEYPVTKIGN